MDSRSIRGVVIEVCLVGALALRIILVSMFCGQGFAKGRTANL